MFEVGDERVTGLVHVFRLAADAVRQIAVMIPARMIKLDETHVAFGHSPREQTIRGEGAGTFCLVAVKRKGAVRFLRNIHDFRHARLHAVSHFVLGDPRVDFRIAEVLELQRLQFRQPIQHFTAAPGGHAVGVLQEQHRVLATAELHSLMQAGQETVPPKPRVKRLVDAVFGNEDDKRGEIFVRAAEAVTEPRAHARPSGQLRASLKERDRRVVIDGLGVHGLDEAEFVHKLRRPRHQVADPRAALAVLRELEDGAGHGQRGLIARHTGQALAHAHAGGQVLPVVFVERGFVVEQIELRRPAGHEQVNDAVGFGREMRPGQNAFERIFQFRQRRAEGVAVEQAEERGPAEAEREPAKEFAAVHRKVDVRAVHRNKPLIYANLR